MMDADDVASIIILILIKLFYRLAEHINRYMTVVQCIVSTVSTNKTTTTGDPLVIILIPPPLLIY